MALRLSVFSVPSRMKERLSAGGRLLLSGRPRKQESDHELYSPFRKVHFECEELTGDVIEYVIEAEIFLEQEDLDRLGLAAKTREAFASKPSNAVPD
jgi:hypothetical protein